MLLGAAGHICANFATCSWEPLAMLNPQFVAGEHGLFGGHKSEDIRSFFMLKMWGEKVQLSIYWQGLPHFIFRLLRYLQCVYLVPTFK